MERKNFLKTGIGLIGIGAIANSCTKEVDSSNMMSANRSDGATAPPVLKRLRKWRDLIRIRKEK